MRHPGARVEPRCDLFSLGCIFFELLTGQRPYSSYPITKQGARMIEERRKKPPLLRRLNRAVTPAIEAIVLKLLAGDPKKRYQDARELQTDLERHQAHLPLKYAREASTRERVRKWVRRHPRALPALGCLIAFVATCGTGIALWSERKTTRRLDAENQRHAMAAGLSTWELDLTPMVNKRRREAAAPACRETLTRYGALDNPKWMEHPLYQSLPKETQDEVRQQVGEALYLLALNDWKWVRDDKQQNEPSLVQPVMKLVQQAEGAFGNSPPPSVHHLTAELAKALGDEQAAFEARAREQLRKSVSARDYYLQGVEAAADMRFPAAIGFLNEAVDREPSHYAAQFLLAYCLQIKGESTRALERYAVARALRSSDPYTSYNRGLIFARDRQRSDARVEFTLAIEADPKLGLAYKERSFLYRTEGKWKEMRDDLDHALENEVSPIQVYLLRAEANTHLKDTEAAERDRKAASNLQPIEAEDFLVQGNMRINSDPKSALRDFETAERLSPSAYSPLQLQAHILAEKLHDPDRAIEKLNRAVRLFPETPTPVVSRALLYARTGRREEAIQDAERTSVLTDDPETLQVVATVYVLTSKMLAVPQNKGSWFGGSALEAQFASKTASADQDRALDALRRAVRSKNPPNPSTLTGDQDLAPLFETAAFKEIIRYGRERWEKRKTR